jgi:hypothetical protein
LSKFFIGFFMKRTAVFCSLLLLGSMVLFFSGCSTDWDIAFEVGRKIYTNSGVTATETRFNVITYLGYANETTEGAGLSADKAFTPHGTTDAAARDKKAFYNYVQMAVYTSTQETG